MLLIVAILFEVFGTTMLKLSDGFSSLYPSVGVVIGFTTSFILLGLSLKGLPLSTAYAIWAGTGTALTAVMGVILFEEGVAFLKVLALLLIIIGVILLNKSRDDDAEGANV